MKDVTYVQFVCMVCPKKAEPSIMCITVRYYKFNCPGEVATPTVKILVAKVSTPGAKFMTMNILHFYLMTPLKRPEFICINLQDIPEEIIQ